MADEEFIAIKKDRLRDLEKLESDLPNLIEEAIKEYKANALKRLHEKDKSNPKAVAERARRYAEKNRDILNERRRNNRRNKRMNDTETMVVEIVPPPTRPTTYTINETKLITFE